MISLLFALSHLQYHDVHVTPAAVEQLGYTLVAGLVLGWLRARSASLAPSTLLHACGNALLKLAALI